MELARTPETLSCAECGDEIGGAGYLPARASDDGYEPVPDAAVCDDCGFNGVGMAGCAPDPGDLFDPGPDGVLLYVRSTGDGLDVLSTKE